MKLLAQGAEAVITLEDAKEGSYIIKERVKKSYRIPELDEQIRKQRTSMEANLLDKARRAGIHAPLVLDKEGSKLKMEYIDGKKLKDALNNLHEKEIENISKKIGEIISKLHSAGIMHGDLTTSNILLKENIEGKVRETAGFLLLIDFGLGKFSRKIEDQATDLYLLYEALNSTHSQILEICWKNILESYCSTYPKAKDVMKRFDQISKRRRYKTGS